MPPLELGGKGEDFQCVRGFKESESDEILPPNLLPPLHYPQARAAKCTKHIHTIIRSACDFFQSFVAFRICLVLSLL